MTTRTTTQLRPALMAATAALALGIAGCGSPAPDATNDPEVGPITAFYESVWSGFTEEMALAEFNRQEEAVAECMREQGFEYQPARVTSVTVGENLGQSDPLPGEGPLTIEFASQYGYGATSNPGAGDSDTGVQMEGDFSSLEYGASLAEPERTAWNLALYGPLDESGSNSGGCLGRGFEAAGESVLSVPEEFAPLDRDARAVAGNTADDPEMVELAAEWTACMADVGYPGYRAPGEPAAEFADEYQRIWDDNQATLPESPSAADIEEAMRPTMERANALARSEIVVAVADATCRAGIGYDQAYQQTQIRLEQEFYDAHQVEFEAWRTAVQEAMASGTAGE